MTEINKRILTSIVLIAVFFASLSNQIVLFLALILCFYQIFYEFFNMLNKIFIKKNKFKLYLLSFISLAYIMFAIIKILEVIYNNLFDQKVLLLLIITICIFTDIGGIFFGKLFKGKKLSSISPNKTYSGALGSYLLSTLFACLIFKNYLEINNIIIISFVTSTISQFGDLFISFLKRKSKIKDTGNILPGHGGFLDRFDGIIFAIPLGLIIF